MRLPTVTLAVFIISSLWTYSAKANENHQNIINPDPNTPEQTTTNQGNQAENLLTQPATIDSKWQSESPQNYLQQKADSIPVVRQEECAKINPIEYLNNPEKFFKECPNTNNQNRQAGEPVEYLKVPRLDSGIKVNVGEF
ncbi:hypothetical protein B6N60_03160 [Richelia sinica FACHB-800]|uniref:Uncharacterized protein n=1 Tax=Richelia sinica FACHB-800 TaxID=1357546 RepID=A0A975T9L8_9NOST|nr:hypothetical protein [Richelia sinica]MBD2663292.1 hypothetical protein [Richelia sinica FACHB-800]QXE24455.1 hypothetical protein B6N60_03160 [Richelia sinica FACHB-800]